MLEKIGQYEFDVDTSNPQKKVLLPKKSGLINMKDVLENSRADLARISEEHSFVLIRGVDWKGRHDDAVMVPPGISPDWHYDTINKDAATVLVNPYKGNDRGLTQWVERGIYAEHFAEVAQDLIRIESRAATSGEGHLTHWVNEFFAVDGDSDPASIERRDNILSSINSFLPFVRSDIKSDIDRFFAKIDETLKSDIISSDWKDCDNTALVFNNDKGLHKGVYRASSRAKKLFSME